MSPLGNISRFWALAADRRRLGLAAVLTALLLMAVGSPIDRAGAARDGLLIVEIPIDGTIEMGLAPFIARAVREADELGADAILFKMDTFGGRIDAAVRIRDTLLHCELPTVVWVSGRAISAGALITLAAETVVMDEGASIGAATPVQITPGGKSEATGEKTVSYMRAEMRATADARGRDSRIAEAMVDADIEIAGVSEAGKLLSLTAKEALELGIADHVAKNRAGMLAAMGWENAEIRRVEPNWSEMMVRFLTHPIIAGMLLSLGGLALLIELRSPGLGIPGLLGVIFLGLYFGSHFLVNLAGKVELLLFVGGLILILLEVFVIPGFGAAGILGGLMLTAGLLLARVAPHGGTSEITQALGFLLISFFVTLTLFILVLKYLPQARWMGHIVLDTSQQHSAGYHADQHEGQVNIGDEGSCLTDLRPAGTMLAANARLDVITSGEYIEKGALVRVIEVKGNRIVVEESPEEA